MVSITITLKDKQLTLSLEEAQELKDTLNNMLGNNNIYTVPHNPFIIPNLPYYKVWTSDSSDGEKTNS